MKFYVIELFVLLWLSTRSKFLDGIQRIPQDRHILCLFMLFRYKCILNTSPINNETKHMCLKLFLVIWVTCMSFAHLKMFLSQGKVDLVNVCSPENELYVYFIFIFVIVMVCFEVELFSLSLRNICKVNWNRTFEICSNSIWRWIFHLYFNIIEWSLFHCLYILI